MGQNGADCGRGSVPGRLRPYTPVARELCPYLSTIGSTLNPVSDLAPNPLNLPLQNPGAAITAQFTNSYDLSRATLC